MAVLLDFSSVALLRTLFVTMAPTDGEHPQGDVSRLLRV